MFEPCGIRRDAHSFPALRSADLPTKAADLPASVWINDGAPINFAYQSPVAAGLGKQYVLTQTPNTTSPYTFSSAHTFTRTYGTQWQITFAHTGIGTDTGTNNVVT